MMQFGESLLEGEPLYFYSVSLVASEKGSRHLSSKLQSKTQEAFCKCPRAKPLKVANVSATPKKESASANGRARL